MATETNDKAGAPSALDLCGRRDFVRACGRVAALGGLAALGAAALLGRDKTCVSNFVCRDCRLLPSCALPEGERARNATGGRP